LYALRAKTVILLDFVGTIASVLTGLRSGLSIRSFLVAGDRVMRIHPLRDISVKIDFHIKAGNPKCPHVKSRLQLFETCEARFWRLNNLTSGRIQGFLKHLTSIVTLIYSVSRAKRNAKSLAARAFMLARTCGLAKHPPKTSHI
jgi:hypothetical protein